MLYCGVDVDDLAVDGLGGCEGDGVFDTEGEPGKFSAGFPHCYGVDAALSE